MEIQVPLILFTTFLAWSTGVFGSQALCAIKGKATKTQIPALIATLVLLGIGGISVCFHLAQPLHIFNGFGNLTSGITQELIAIVVMVIWMVVYFSFLRRNENKVPQWCAIIAVAISLILVVVMAHSYMMSARPAWNNALQILSLVGAACMLGPATVSVLAAKFDPEDEVSLQVIVGAAIGALTTILYCIAMAFAGGSYTTIGYNFDPTEPNKALFDASTVVSPFAGDALIPTIISIVAVIAGVAVAYMGKKKGNWKIYGSVIVVLGVAAAIALRVSFYLMGNTLYGFFD